MAVTKKVRDTVFSRDRNKCVVCGTTDGLTIQHRKNRQMGGSKLRDGMSNLVTMCWEHNTSLESNAVFARWGRDNGWKLLSHDDPASCPVFYPLYGLWFELTDDGFAFPVEGGLNAA